MSTTMNSCFRLRWWLGALLGLGLVSVQAQIVDPPVGVATKIWVSGVATSSTGAFTLSGDFLPSSPTASDGSATVSLTPQDGDSVLAILGANGYVRVEPAKTYTVNVETGYISNGAINILAPPGYRVVMDNQFRTRELVTGDKIVTFQLLPLGARHPGLAGMASSISSLDVDWRVSLGSLLNGGSAGDLALIDTGIRSDWSVIASPSSLYYEPTSSEIAVYRPNNVIQQIIANQVAVDVVPLPATAPTYFEIRCYNPSQCVGSSFPVTFTGQPYVTYRIEKGATATSLKLTKEVIDVSDPNATGLSVARREIMTLSRTGTWPNISWTKTDWTLENQTPVNEVDVTSSGTTSSRTETIGVKTPGGATAVNLTRNYSTPTDTNGMTVIGEVLSGETVGSTNGLNANFNYYTNASTWGSLGYVQSTALPGGGWTAYDYYTGDPTQGQVAGRVKYAYKPYLNAPASAAHDPSSGVVTYYEYTNDVFGSPSRPSLIQTTVNGTMTSRTQFVYQDTNSVFGLGVTSCVRTDYTDSGHQLQTTTGYYRDDATDPLTRSQTYAIIKSDGTKECFAYERGFWDGSNFVYNMDYGNASRVTTVVACAHFISGVMGGVATPGGYGMDGGTLIDGKSTADVTIRDSRALVVRTESWGWKSGAWVLLSYTNYTYDFAGRLLQRVASNGATYTATYSGGLKTSETDEAGVTTNYTYDAGDRILTTTRVGVGAIPSVTTKFTYDATGKTLETDVGYGQTEMITTQAQYDDAGRIVTETPAGGYGVVTHSYDVANRTSTVTAADGGTTITTANLDGSPASTTGTATVPTYHTYGVETDGRQWHQVNSGTATSPRWQKSWVDWVGRALETDSPGFTGQPTIVSTNVYENGTGHLLKTTKTGFAPTLYQYDYLGQVSRSGLDYDNNGLLDLASNDRITETESYFENYNGAWWVRTDNRTYPKLGMNTLVVTSTSRTRMTGFATNRLSETQGVDAEGNLTDQIVNVNRSAATSVATTTKTGITGSMVENTVDGLSVSVTGFDGLITTTAYDALLRPLSVTDSRGNTTTTGYVSGTKLPQTVTDAAGDVAVTSYDNVGRVSWTRDPRNFYTRLAYNQRGQTIEQWGDGTMPVQYGYDSTYGDKLTMSTYRGGANWSGTTWPSSPGTADTTTWTYDAPSGLLTTKTDALGKAVTQTYNERGQTAARTLARGVSTTYGYDSSTGELITQNYSDSTPAVTYMYGRTGQVTSVSDYTGFRDLVYDPTKPWRMTAEAESSFYAGRVITRNYDNTTVLGRVNGFQVGTAPGSNADLEQTFGFTTVGRFASIASNRTSDSAATHTFTYGYLSNAALLQSVNYNNTFTITRSYEAHRDLITSINAQWNGTSRTKYDYAYDERGQRTSTVQSGDVFSDYGDSTFHLYTYDGRGEVTGDVGYLGSTVTDQSRPLPGRHYGFAYDNAGNRQWSDRTGVDANNDGLPDMRDNYTTNAANQYVSRENNTVPLSGTAAPDTAPAGGAGGVSVAIKGRTVAAGRQGRYWNDEVTVANTLHPWRGPVTIFTAKRGTTGSPDVYRMDSRMVEIAAVLQTFSYDDDGNLTSDGLVDYTWDAENRLIRMETSANAQTYGFPHRLIEFKYDYMGRRVQKRVVDVDQNIELYARRYLYDGWNLVAEFLAPGGTTVTTLVRSYTWGLDIALSMTNAGGVGALLQIADHPTGKTYVPTYDGNGNVVALLNASTGTLAAAYEYSPYGEALRCDVLDSVVADQPFRFSTKYYDAETSLYYYGYRYYSPSQGRFLGRDPSEEKGGLHLYAFCLNNSINGWDVLGRDPMYEYGYGGAKFEVTHANEVWAVFNNAAGSVDTSQWSEGDNMMLARLQSEDGQKSAYDGNLGYLAAWDPQLRERIPIDALGLSMSLASANFIFGTDVQGGMTLQVAISADGAMQLIGSQSPTGQVTFMGRPVSQPGGIDQGVNLDFANNRTAAGSIVTPSGTFKIMVHGTETSVEVNGVLVNGDEFAGMLLNTPGYHYTPGATIMLVGCATGGPVQVGQNFAQTLSTALGVTVIAPTNTVLASDGVNAPGPPGTLTIVQLIYDDKGNPVDYRPDPNGGTFISFTPKPPPPVDPTPIDVITPIDIPPPPGY